jgi:hypothetical protein
MKPRDLIKCDCNNCGSSFDVFYDISNDFYICRECLDIEENEENNEEEEEEEDD